MLSVEDEAVIVAFRKHALLPLDDCLYRKNFKNYLIGYFHVDIAEVQTAEEYQALLKKHKMVCSMSPKRNCWENQRSVVSRAVGERA